MTSTCERSWSAASRSGSRRHALEKPLLLFNGIGANWHIAKPFLQALTNTSAIIFDVPGIGGSPLPPLPYRPSSLARLAAGLVAQLGHQELDVAGVSWGGGVAQQFAHQHDDMCRRLILAATSPGAIMVPGRLSVIWKHATPRRYIDRAYMRSIAARRVLTRPRPHRKTRAGAFGVVEAYLIRVARGLAAWALSADKN